MESDVKQAKGKGGRPPSPTPSVGTSLKMTPGLAKRLDDYVQGQVERGVYISKSFVIQRALVEFLERQEQELKESVEAKEGKAKQLLAA